MTRWEYLVRHDLTQGDLNALGRQGWELVSVALIAGKRSSVHHLKRPLGGA